MKKLLTRVVRQSPAMIVAMLALFVALTGTAVATTSALITGNQIKNSSITGADIKNKSLRPIDFRGSVRGPRGLAGPTGASGAAGAKGDKGDKGDKGASGATGSALLTGQATTLPSAGPGSTFFRRAAVNGVTPISVFPSEVASLTPGRALLARDLTARIVMDIPAGGSVRVDLVANAPGNFSDGSAPTELSCTITGTAGTDDKSCTAPGPMALSPASIIFVRVTIAGAAPSTDPQRAYWGITVEPA